MCLPLGERAFLIGSHKATVPGNIGCKNGCKASRYAFAGQEHVSDIIDGRSSLVVMIVAWWRVKGEAQWTVGAILRLKGYVIPALRFPNFARGTLARRSGCDAPLLAIVGLAAHSNLTAVGSASCYPLPYRIAQRCEVFGAGRAVQHLNGDTGCPSNPH